MCCDCIGKIFRCTTWASLKMHYKENHPGVSPGQYYTKEAKKK